MVNVIDRQEELPRSYAQKLVTARSGGGLKLLDAIDECNALNDLGHTVCAIELSPFALSRHHQLESHGEAGFSTEAPFGFAGTMADRGESAFDWVGGSDVLPVFRRKVIESEQGLAVLDQL